MLVLLPTSVRAAEPETVYAVGDSITQGGGAAHEWQAWPDRIGALKEGRKGGCLVVTPCWKQTSMSLQYHDKVLAKHPDVVIMAYGINDLATGAVSPEDIVDGLRRIDRQNTRRGIDTYFATVTPVGIELWGVVGPQRIVLNRLIRAEFGDRVLHFSRLLTDPASGLLAEEFDSGDGLHPNASAYKLMAREAALTLRRDGHMVRLPRK